jgi:hypothetical protein
MLTSKQITANQQALRFALTIETYIQQNIYSDFSCSVNLDWSTARRSSRGGIYKNGPGINIAMSSAALIDNSNQNVYRFYEYPSYDSDKVIGGFYSKDYTDKLYAIIAHEVAHAVQFFEYKKLSIRCKPHGPIFKKYYSLFRKQFINEYIPKNQLSLKDQYDEQLVGLVRTIKSITSNY